MCLLRIWRGVCLATVKGRCKRCFGFELVFCPVQFVNIYLGTLDSGIKYKDLQIKRGLSIGKLIGVLQEFYFAY